MTTLWAQVLALTLCLAQASGHGKVFQAWLADDGGKSLLVVDAAPKHLLDSTIFSRLLGLRDTSIGDGVTDTQVTDPPAEGTAAPAEVTDAGGDSEGGVSGDGVRVTEMSHQEAVYPAVAGGAAGPETVRPQQPRQPDSRLAMLTLWKQMLVDAFVAKLDRFTGDRAHEKNHTTPVPTAAETPKTAEEEPELTATATEESTVTPTVAPTMAVETASTPVPASASAASLALVSALTSSPAPSSSEETEPTQGDSEEIGDTQETAAPPEDEGQNADGLSGHNNHGQSMEGGTDQELSTQRPMPASEDSADATTTELPPVNEYEKAVAQWEEASIDDNDQMLEELLESFAVITAQGFAETTPEDGPTDEIPGSGHSPAELHSGLSESTEREHDVGATNSTDESKLDEIEHTKTIEFEPIDASSGIESSGGSSSIPEQIEHSGHDTPNDSDEANANTVMLESLIAAMNASEDADSMPSDSQEHASGTTNKETAQKQTYVPAGDPNTHSTDNPEDMHPPAYGSQGTEETATYTDEPLFPMRYPDRRPSARSEVRAELPAGVVSVGDQQEIAFTPTAETRRTSVQFKPTAVIDGGHFDPEEYGLTDGPPADSAPRQRSAPRLRDSLSAVVEAAEAGMLLVQPDWRGPGIMAVPMHRRPPAEMVCYLMVKQGACRCTHTRCAAFRKYMEYKCPETCEKVPVAPEPAGVSRGVRTRLLSSVRLPERPLGILSKCRGTALLMPRCRATQTYVAHPIFCECYRVCSGEFAGLTACPSGEHFSTQEAETRVCVPFEESTCRTWSRLVTKP
ncbi:uncharacterized protein LOC122374658 [Amphibalanus amphitrite]|uniref:uncharacterized protein LOC122374658 n=1 Tax=Amphibalanus amphitrite TaxID=1232801 RepID=UPI001C8FCDEC|nr:uncharacterized protein LOC122374658 [Amphibalanus amphitrite]